MYTFLIVSASILSIILMIMVLLQSSKGGGLAGTFGGAGNMGTMFGTRRTADFLGKATWWLGGCLFIISIVVNLFFLPGQSTQSQRDSIIQNTGRNAIPQKPALPQQIPLPTTTNKPPVNK
ncbi:MAG: preprotein translocase subunit SecG [Bacteroidetes bacterium]|nr:preprotein translocase subunit SecG [Bacteroidota bacterium]